MERDAVRRWINGHRAAERRNLELMQREGPMSSEASFRAAMELCDLAAPVDSDPVVTARSSRPGSSGRS